MFYTKFQLFYSISILKNFVDKLQKYFRCHNQYRLAKGNLDKTSRKLIYSKDDIFVILK